MERKNHATTLAYVSAACLAIGSFLPWVTITAPLVGSISKSGTEGTDGWGTVIVAFTLAGIAYFWSDQTSRAPGFVAMAVMVLAGGLLAWEYADIGHRFADMDSSLILTNYGIGLHLCALGAFGGFVSGIMYLDGLGARRMKALETV